MASRISMKHNIAQSIRGRFRVPLEWISASTIATTLSWSYFAEARRNGGRVPFMVCGFEYAQPSDSVLQIIAVLSSLSLFYSFWGVVPRCLELWCKRNESGRMAHLVSCSGTDILNDRIALYARKWWSHLHGLVLIMFLNGWLLYLGIIANDIPLVGVIVFTVLQTLNFLLAVINITNPKQKVSVFLLIVDMISTLATAREFDDPKIETHEWITEEITLQSQHQINAIQRKTCAVVELEVGKFLWIQGDGDTGILAPHPAPVLGKKNYWPISKCSFVRITNRPVGFTLKPLRMPYSVMWYSVYRSLLSMGAYNGADDIEKCLLWLLFVSFLTALFVSCIPGPSLVIANEEDDESAEVV